MGRQSSCEHCTFCQWTEKDGKQIQTGCQVQQLDRYKQLKDRNDPQGHAVDNAIFKLTDAGDKRFYVINYPCLFQRSRQWFDENIHNVNPDCDPDNPVYNQQQLREYVLSTIPFDYGAVVIAAKGNVKQSLRTCKSMLNQTVPPLFLEVVFPYKYLADKGKEELFLALQDRIGKDITKPYSWFKFNIRQVVNSSSDNIQSMIREAIQGKCEVLTEEDGSKFQLGFFWILVLQEGTKIDERFMESIKRQTLGELLDWHVISLTPRDAVLVRPVFDGTSEFAHWATFTYKDGQLIQEYKVDNVREFFTIAE